MAVTASASKAQQPVDHQNRLIQSAWSRADLDHLRRFMRIVCAENVEKRFLTTEAPQVDHRRCTRMIQKWTPIWRPAVEYLNVPYISHPLTHLGCRSQRITILTTPTMQDFMTRGTFGDPTRIYRQITREQRTGGPKLGPPKAGDHLAEHCTFLRNPSRWSHNPVAAHTPLVSKPSTPGGVYEVVSRSYHLNHFM